MRVLFIVLLLVAAVSSCKAATVLTRASNASEVEFNPTTSASFASVTLPVDNRVLGDLANKASGTDGCDQQQYCVSGLQLPEEVDGYKVSDVVVPCADNVYILTAEMSASTSGCSDPTLLLQSSHATLVNITRVMSVGSSAVDFVDEASSSPYHVLLTPASQLIVRSDMTSGVHAHVDAGASLIFDTSSAQLQTVGDDSTVHLQNSTLRADGDVVFGTNTAVTGANSTLAVAKLWFGAGASVSLQGVTRTASAVSVQFGCGSTLHLESFHVRHNVLFNFTCGDGVVTGGGAWRVHSSQGGHLVMKGVKRMEGVDIATDSATAAPAEISVPVTGACIKAQSDLTVARTRLVSSMSKVALSPEMPSIFSDTVVGLSGYYDYADGYERMMEAILNAEYGTTPSMSFSSTSYVGGIYGGASDNNTTTTCSACDTDAADNCISTVQVAPTDDTAEPTPANTGVLTKSVSVDGALRTVNTLLQTRAASTGTTRTQVQVHPTNVNQVLSDVNDGVYGVDGADALLVLQDLSAPLSSLVAKRAAIHWTKGYLPLTVTNSHVSSVSFEGQDLTGLADSSSSNSTSSTQPLILSNTIIDGPFDSPSGVPVIMTNVTVVGPATFAGNATVDNSTFQSSASFNGDMARLYDVSINGTLSGTADIAAQGVWSTVLATAGDLMYTDSLDRSCLFGSYIVTTNTLRNVQCNTRVFVQTSSSSTTNDTRAIIIGSVVGGSLILGLLIVLIVTLVRRYRRGRVYSVLPTSEGAK